MLKYEKNVKPRDHESVGVSWQWASEEGGGIVQRANKIIFYFISRPYNIQYTKTINKHDTILLTILL